MKSRIFGLFAELSDRPSISEEIADASGFVSDISLLFLTAYNLAFLLSLQHIPHSLRSRQQHALAQSVTAPSL